ncbi:MAG: T9SS type A sorting domain-containing protein [Bacteroidetes bacterium]|nr:T9SS type A sorting domain-containing protein [Bacteroidota bacterium]
MKRSSWSKYFFLLILVFQFVQQLCSQTFKAVDDTIDMVPGFPKTVNLLANDIIPAGDSIRVTGGFSAGSGSVTSTWHYQGLVTYVVPNRGVGNIVIGTYTLVNVSSSQTSTARMIFRIRDKSYDTLQINDLAAIFTVSGLHFQMLFNTASWNGSWIPKGSSTSTLFTNAFWIGGLDEHDSLHLAAERYRQGPYSSSAGTKPDFYAGPVMDTVNYSIYQDTTWNYVWNLKRSDIEYHTHHWNDAGYKPAYDILTWPGNGNTALGQAAQLAPFHDANGDGIYNPFAGDSPAIRGDQCLFFIFNDERGQHLETTGRKLRAEIHGMAYAYDLPGDSAFSKTMFLNYKIYNRSLQTYHDAWMGTSTDMDIGYANDDYQQCDVGRGSIIGYNGKAVDGSGQSYAYGAHPPAQSVTILAGPWMEPTGADRPRYDNNGHPLCNEGVNGAGFGDGIADNERIGLKTFSYFLHPYYNPPPYMYQPAVAGDYYRYMQAIWMDNTRMVYGGNGHDGYGGYGPEASFLYPGESDTLNWGCGCQQPNGPVNWTEITAHNLPHDIRGAGTTGPFTWHPGEMQELDIAFVWARDYTSPDTLASVAKLRSMIDTVRKAFLTNRLPGGGSFLGITEQPVPPATTCSIYPNPATAAVTIDFGAPLKGQVNLEILNSSGMLLQTVICHQGSIQSGIDVSVFPTGLYLLKFNGGNIHYAKKLSVCR